MASIRIRVGASLDRSADVVFTTMENRSKRAAKTIERNLNQGGFGGKGGPYRTMAREAEQAFAVAGRASSRFADRVARDQQRAARESARFYAQIGKIAEREMMRATRAQMAAERAADRARVRQVDRFATRTSHRATRFFWPNAPIMHHGARMMGDIVRGAGVDFSIGNSVSRAVSREQAAIGLAQQERIATGGRTAGAAHFQALSEKTGDALRIDPERATELARAFTGKTGEFGKVGELLERFAPMAVASGTSFEDMGSAAGFFFNQVKHLPDALGRTEEGLRAIIGQTAVGSVEMPDFAKEMGRVAANANKFEGDRGENIAKLAALAQLSIESGGATSAADAARSVAAFGNTFGKNARIASFKKHGVELFTDETQTQMRDPFEIIRDAFRQTNGNIPAIGEMFMDTLGRKPVNALGQAFQGAGGGEAGMRAIDKMLARFMTTKLSKDAQKLNVAEHLNSKAARAQKFQNDLDKVIAGMADKVLPALEKLAPKALAAAEAIGKLTEFAVENPGKAITAAIVASITRAGLESALRAAIEKAVFRMPLGGGAGHGVPLPAGGGAPVAGAPAAAAGGFGTLAPLAAVAGAALAADQASKLQKELGTKGSLLDILPGFKGGSFGADTLLTDLVNPFAKQGRFADSLMETGVALHDVGKPTEERMALQKGVAFAGQRGASQAQRALATSEDVAALGQKIDNLSREMSAMRTGTQRVTVTNLDQVRVDPAGRQPPAAP